MSIFKKKEVIGRYINIDGKWKKIKDCKPIDWMIINKSGAIDFVRADSIEVIYDEHNKLTRIELMMGEKMVYYIPLEMLEEIIPDERS